VQPELQSFLHGRGRGDVTGVFQQQGDVIEILGNKDETSLLRLRNQTEDGGMLAYRAGADGLQRKGTLALALNERTRKLLARSKNKAGNAVVNDGR
jgi:hypothetical protein